MNMVETVLLSIYKAECGGAFCNNKKFKDEFGFEIKFIFMCLCCIPAVWLPIKQRDCEIGK